MPATANPHRHVLRQLNRSAAPPSALAARPRVDPLAHIDPSVELPPDVVIRSGAYLPAGVWLGAGCEIGPNVAFIDGAPTCVKRGVRIGANATVHAGITLCAGAVVQPGAVANGASSTRSWRTGGMALAAARALELRTVLLQLRKSVGHRRHRQVLHNREMGPSFAGL